MRLSWIAASALLAVLLAGSRAQAQQKIGVVRVGEVVSNMAEGKKASQAGQSRQNDAKQQESKWVNDIQSLQGQLQQLKEGSAQWNDLRDQVEKKQLDYEIWGKQTQNTLARAAKEDLRKLFDHVSEATQQIAIEQHFNLVIADNSPKMGASLDGVTVQQLGNLLAERNVLFADKTVDITQDVLTRVDALFAKQNQAGPATPVQPGGK